MSSGMKMTTGSLPDRIRKTPDKKNRKVWCKNQVGRKHRYEWWPKYLFRNPRLPDGSKPFRYVMTLQCRDCGQRSGILWQDQCCYMEQDPLETVF